MRTRTIQFASVLIAILAIATISKAYGTTSDGTDSAPSATPEPSSLALLGSGLTLLAANLRRRKHYRRSASHNKEKILMRIRLLLAAALLSCTTLAAPAATFELFNLNVTLANSGTITGTVDLDLSSTITQPTFDSTANLVYTLGTTSTPISGPNELFGTITSTLGDSLLFGFAIDPFSRFELILPTNAMGTLSGFSGGLCSGGCPISNSDVFESDFNSESLTYVTSGTFLPADAPSPAPEPRSLALLGSGLALFLIRFPTRLRPRKRSFGSAH